MSLLKNTRTALLNSANNLSKDQSMVAAGTSAVWPHAATIKRFGRIALAIVLAIVIVTAIVALKSLIWIPRLYP
jgi:hypothetical protein